MAKTTQRSDFSQMLLDTVRANGGLFTIFAVALIVLTGFTLINNPANWWIPVAAVLAFFGAIFLFMNARVIIKATVAFALAFLFAGLAFKEGTYADPSGAGGLLWLSLTLVAFFTGLSLSYFLASGASRWGSLIIAQSFGFVTTYIISYGFATVTLGTFVGFAVALLGFLALYRFGRRTYVSRSMPVTEGDDALLAQIAEAADKAAYETTVVRGRRGALRGVLVWDEYAYLLVPVRLLTPFGYLGRKQDRLSYDGKSINSWLLRLALRDAPLWRTRSAPIMPVVLDLRNRNGKLPRVIGAALPDSKRQLPVGVFPAKLFTSSDDAALCEAFRGFRENFEEFAAPLSSKQQESLKDLATH
jgi:hypothetical protein